MRGIFFSILLIIATPAAAGTLTCTAAGFANLGTVAPANWPNGVAFPASGNPNGSKVYTISDADWLSLLTWTASSQSAALAAAPTAQQILLAWIQVWANGTKGAIQQFNTIPAQVPAPITMQ